MEPTDIVEYKEQYLREKCGNGLVLSLRENAADDTIVKVLFKNPKKGMEKGMGMVKWVYLSDLRLKTTRIKKIKPAHPLTSIFTN